MSNKFVLESFESYLRFIEDNIYEAKEEFVPTIDFVKGYVQRLLEKQKEIEKIGFEIVPFDITHTSLLYHRENQFVGREIWKFRKK